VRERPFREPVRLAFSDFFTMFQIPFDYGGPWGKASDAKPEPVVVIDRAVNQQLFGGGNNVGKIVRIGEREFKVSGIIGDWHPSYRYYDTQQGVVAPERVFIPLNFTEPMKIQTSGNSDGWTSSGNTFEELLHSEQDWVQLWVELPQASQQQAYRAFLENYVRDQKKHGRFQRPLHYELTSMPELNEQFGVVPKSVKAMSVVSLLFLIVCSLNLVGLLLGKFLARIPEVSVRRALGASRANVFWQHVVECELVGIVGGVAGLAMSAGLLAVIGAALHQDTGNSISGVSLDLEMVTISVLLSLVAGLLAGIYPSWRVCSVAPAMQLKLQ
jgi:putative ABC transport system permease protein